MADCLYNDARIKISRRCNGYYLRWYYNGWHYWLFASGSIFFDTEGENYRTLGRQKMRIGSTQMTEDQTTAVRTIMNAREIYILTDAGWGAVRVEPGSWEVLNNMTHGYDVEITIIIGSRAISSSGFSPAIILPTIEPTYEYCELLTIGTQVWMCLNYDADTPGSRVMYDDEDNRTPYGGLYTHSQVMTPGFCPEGWKVPTLDDWEELINYIGSTADGGKLKRDGTTYWNHPNTGAANEELFDMRSTGFYGFVLGPGTDYHYAGQIAMLWAQDGFVRFDYNSGAVSLNNFILPNYYYGVRLLKDGCFLMPVVATPADVESDYSFTANWNTCIGATGYFVDVSTDPAFGSFVHENYSVGNVLTYEFTGLTPGTTYYYRVRAEGSNCETGGNSNTITVTLYEAFTITSRGDGSGVAYLYIETSEDVTLRLDGTARFYSDAAGTLDESTEWICTASPGSLRQRFIKCPSGTANLMFSKLSGVLRFGNAIAAGSGTSAWSNANLGVLPEANVPGINWNPLTDVNFPNLTEFSFFFGNLSTYTIDIADFPASLLQGLHACSGSISGDVADLPVNCNLIYTNTNTITGDIDDIPDAMIIFSVGGSNTITGDIINLPPNCTYFSCTGNNTIYGDTSDINATVVYLHISGNNTLDGDVADIPANVTTLIIYGQNTIYGVVADFHAFYTRISLGGSNTLAGSIEDMPPLCTYADFTGDCTVSGDFTGLPANMTHFTSTGTNTISGTLATLPATMSWIYIIGNNTISGNISDIPASMTYFVVGGQNTIAGDIADIPANCHTFSLSGLNTVSGDIGDTSTVLYVLNITGNNTIADYTGKTWNALQNSLIITPVAGGGLSSAEVDQLLIDIDSDCSFSTTVKLITLTGTNGAPTATSAAARASLIAKGVTLTTN